MKKKTSHGGPRKGAGRKPGKKAFKNVKKKEDTKVMRIPLSLVKKVEAMIKRHHSGGSASKSTSS